MNKNITFSVLALLMVASLAPAAHADYLYDRSGSLVPINGWVLGDDDEKKVEVEDEKHDESTTNPAANNSSDLARQNEEKQREAAKKQLEREIDARKKLQEKKETRSTLEIKTEKGQLKLKQESRNAGKDLVTKELELRDNESLHVEDSSGERLEIRPEVMELKKAAGRMPESSGRLDSAEGERRAKIELIKDQYKAKFAEQKDRSLSINENNELVVTRPDGSSRVVTVLPDQAAEKFREHGLETSDAALAPELTENEAGEMVYHLEKEEEKRILGFLKLKFKRATEVSAETGEVVVSTVESNPLKQWLSRFVFNDQSTGQR